METQTTTSSILTGTTLKRAIIYARVSTDEQAETGTSIDNQVEKSLAYAKANELHVPESYIFREDYTGKVLDRPELNRVRALIRAAQVDALIVYKTNRLDRSEWGVNLLILLQELKSLGVELHYSQAKRQINLHNPVEALMESISGWQAGEDHRETVTKLHEGRLAKARKGMPIVHDRAPYGYRAIREDKNWELVIDEDEARIIRLIFEWYVGGDDTGPLSYYKIAQKLTEMKIPTRADKDPKFVKTKRGKGEWYASTIGYIISCETYAGVWHYDKRGKDKSEWIAVEVPAIVSRGLWEVAQKIKKQKQERASRNMRYQYLMSGRLTCGCGEYKMAGFGSKSRGRVYTYYRCGGLSQGHKCGLPHFPSGKVDDIVWQWAEDVLRDPQRLKYGLEQFQAEQAKQATPIQQELVVLEELLEQHTNDLNEALASLKVVLSPRAKAAIAADLERIEGTLDSLESQKAELLERLGNSTLTEEDFVTINDWAAIVARDFETIRRDFPSKRYLIEYLDIRGRLAVEDGQQVMYVTAKFSVNKERLLIASQIT
ncbi:MAG: hypothetical protein FOGNACKC_05197 [Anaerolineae bacterium]|nr:hypothetical protein [Anaerolineae bacterium]